ncbi:MAG: hypothetical protein JNL76_03520 [Alphaproteobacteria bacterium]|nr:hypothetical protein [Alphaproteobacteria bacterium]
MSPTAKALFFIFFFLGLCMLAHDIYVWQNSGGHPFHFAALGWILRSYYPHEFQMSVDILGADLFNFILTPLLKLPAFFITMGGAFFIFAADLIRRKMNTLTPGRGKERDQKLKSRRYQ